jgi:hypothetical protein
MWLQALITPTDLLKVFTELTPVRFALDPDEPDRYLWIAQPTRIEIVNGETIRVVTSARVQWDVASIKVPIVLRSLSLRATPAIENEDGHDVLVFGLQIEDADVSAVPGFIETPLVARVNEALEARRSKIAWRFTETLDFHFRMPALTAPRRDVHLYAHYGAVRIGEEGVAIASSFELKAGPHGEADAEPDDPHFVDAPSDTSASSSAASSSL